MEVGRIAPKKLKFVLSTGEVMVFLEGGGFKRVLTDYIEKEEKFTLLTKNSQLAKKEMVLH